MTRCARGVATDLGSIVPGGSDDGYPSGREDGCPSLPHGGSPTLLLLLIPEPGWDREPKGQVVTRMLGRGTPSWEGWDCCHPLCPCSWVAHLSWSPAPRDTSKGETKAGTWCPHVWQHGTVPGRGHGVPASTGAHSVAPPALGLRGRARTAKPSPLPFLHPLGHTLGGKGEQQEQGWPCVPGISPGDGGQPLLCEGVCTFPATSREK